MSYDLHANDTNVDQDSTCTRFNFDAGNSIQPKTDYCATCAAHKFALCSKLDGDELSSFGSSSTHKTFQPGQMLFSECDKAKYFYTIVSGEVRLSRMLDDGRRQITGFKSNGDFIGLSTDGEYTADAEAINEVVVCQFSVPNLNNSMQEFVVVQQRLMEMMQDEVIKLQNHMLLLGRKTPVEKIANFLAERADKVIAHHPEKAEAETLEINLPMSRTDIADYLGLTIETVSRTFTKLRKNGVITLLTSQQVQVNDLEELKFLADGED